MVCTNDSVLSWAAEAAGRNAESNQPKSPERPPSVGNGAREVSDTEETLKHEEPTDMRHGRLKAINMLKHLDKYKSGTRNSASQ